MDALKRVVAINSKISNAAKATEVKKEVDKVEAAIKMLVKQQSVPAMEKVAKAAKKAAPSLKKIAKDAEKKDKSFIDQTSKELEELVKFWEKKSGEIKKLVG